jgi:vacuolar-type H+-ATPase subunit E/Vma4
VQSRVEGQRSVLAARDALLERVFARARERLEAGVDSPPARERLIERAREALRLLPAGDVVVSCRAEVAKLLEAELVGREGVRIEVQDDMPAGFRASGSDGAVVVDATLVALLEMDKPLLAIELMRHLERDAE